MQLPKKGIVVFDEVSACACDFLSVCHGLNGNASVAFDSSEQLALFIVPVWLIWQNVISTGKLLPYERSFWSRLQWAVTGLLSHSWKFLHERLRRRKQCGEREKTHDGLHGLWDIYLNCLRLRRKRKEKKPLPQCRAECQWALSFLQCNLNYFNGILYFTTESPFFLITAESETRGESLCKFCASKQNVHSGHFSCFI